MAVAHFLFYTVFYVYTLHILHTIFYNLEASVPGVAIIKPSIKGAIIRIMIVSQSITLNP